MFLKIYLSYIIDRKRNLMSWQDWLSIISATIGIVSLFITVLTFIHTGSIKRAVENKEKEIKSATIFKNNKEDYVKKISNLSTKSKLSVNETFEFINLLNSLRFCEFFFSEEDKKNDT